VQSEIHKSAGKHTNERFVPENPAVEYTNVKKTKRHKTQELVGPQG